jgi:probable F420-dependent oxidoreductase
MKFSIAFANVGPLAAVDGATRFALAAEAAGFESLWTVEHVVVPAGYESEYPYDRSGKMPGSEDAPIPDPLIWLAFVAAATTTIRLGTGIVILPQRNPVVFAKEVATLDAMSGGRVELGVGVGWLAEEFDAIGVPFRERGARTDDHIEAMRSLWTQDRASYTGRFTDFTDCIQRPQPANGTVPIHIGGHSDAAAKRAGRLGDGFFPGKGSHEELARLIGVMSDTAAEVGRDASAIEVTAGSAGIFGEDPIGDVHRLEDLGVSRCVIPSVLHMQDPETSLSRFGDAVIAKV